MYKFLHIVRDISFIRTHIVFKDSPQVTHYYLLPLYKPLDNITFIKTGTQLIESNNTLMSDFTFLNSAKEEVKYLNFFKSVQPHAFLTSEPSMSFFSDSFINNMKNIAPIIYISHGMLQNAKISTGSGIEKAIKDQYAITKWGKLDHVLTPTCGLPVFNI